MFTLKYSGRKQPPGYKYNSQHLLESRLFVLVL